ncbi:MAG: efflux RND transporter periplasmic adaptor subunit [Termitinemataceae bacterium]|nr:MAG: efflux RND transporter periplasmic adaptor subunit [Termitinemataceae bacterium]
MKNKNYVNVSVNVSINVTIALAVMIAVMASMVSCKKKEDEKKREAPVFAVTTSVLKKGNVLDYIALSGDIVAGSNVDVYSEVGGKVTRVYVKVGDRVSKGSPIAAVDPSQPGMSYVVNVVRSPITGTVTTLPAQIGMQVSPQLSLAQVSGGGALEIQLYVSERFISRIKMGLPCLINLDAYPEESFKGRVSEISPIVDPLSRTMKIKVNVDNQGSKLKAGMFATVKIIVEDKDNAVTIPFTSVLQNGESYFVYIAVTDPTDPAFSIAKRIVVTTGIHTDEIIEVTDGLEEGDELIVKGQTTLSDGSRLNIISAEETRTAPDKNADTDKRANNKGGE